MKSENAFFFWLGLFVTGSFITMAIMFSSMSKSNSENHLASVNAIEKMVANGADPIAARCAVIDDWHICSRYIKKTVK